MATRHLQAQDLSLGSVPGVWRRLIYRLTGLARALYDYQVDGVKVSGDLIFDESTWREFWPNGTALVYRNTNFTLEADVNTSFVWDFRQQLDILLVEENATLIINNLIIMGVPSQSGLGPRSRVPFWNDYYLYPSIVLAPGSKIICDQVDFQYIKPIPQDTCQQYTNRIAFELRQIYGELVRTKNNGITITVEGQRVEPVRVRDAQTNNSLTPSVMDLRWFSLTCREPPHDNGIGLSVGELAAVIIVPVVVLAGALAAGVWWLRRRKRSRQGVAFHTRDLEAGTDKGTLKPIPISEAGELPDAGGSRIDQQTVSSFPSMATSLKHSGTLPSTFAGARFSSVSVLDPQPSDPYSNPSGSTAGGQAGSPPPAASSSSRPTPTTGSTVGSAMHSPLGVGAQEATQKPRGSDSSSPLEPILGEQGEKEEGGPKAEVYDTIPDIVKARSEHNLLKDLELGPVIGRGSYGKVYKGRWKAAIVAVKVVEYRSGQLSSGNRLNIARESVLSTSIGHPNVVTTYHISTFCLSGKQSQPREVTPEEDRMGDAEQDEDSLSGVGSDTGEVDPDAHPTDDQLETWLILEYCDRDPETFVTSPFAQQ